MSEPNPVGKICEFCLRPIASVKNWQSIRQNVFGGHTKSPDGSVNAIVVNPGQGILYVHKTCGVPLGFDGHQMLPGPNVIGGFVQSQPAFDVLPKK